MIRALVLPGLAASDRSTVALRSALAWQGIRVHRWNLGANHPTPELTDALRSELSGLREDDRARSAANLEQLSTLQADTAERLAQLQQQTAQQLEQLHSDSGTALQQLDTNSSANAQRLQTSLEQSLTALQELTGRQLDELSQSTTSQLADLSQSSNKSAENNYFTDIE